VAEEKIEKLDLCLELDVAKKKTIYRRVSHMLTYLWNWKWMLNSYTTSR